MTASAEKPDAICVLRSEHRHGGRRGEDQQWTVIYEGCPIVSGARDPEHTACRALRAMGVTGSVLFVHEATGTPGLRLKINTGAALTTVEGDRGLRTQKYVPHPATVRTSAANLPGSGITAAHESGGDQRTEPCEAIRMDSDGGRNGDDQ